MRTILSWGRYPAQPQTPHDIAWRNDLPATWANVVSSHKTTLAFGNGRSYGDSCLAASSHVLRTRSLDRLIGVNWETGVLRAEPGITLEEILEVAIPRGWMLPVTPGTKYATLGGAIANDVHGKNHHVRGTFGRHVRRFMLARSDGTMLECSADTNVELYSATIGGLGLTGLIQWAEIQLMSVRSSRIDVTSIRFGNLDEFFALSEAYDPVHEYSVAWVDCLGQGEQLGRGIFMVGDHAHEGPLEVDRRGKRTVPFTFPVPIFNKATLRAFNGLYYHRQQTREARSTVSYDQYFYPLDGLLEWNRIYGRRGFQQYQCVVPRVVARDATRDMLRAIADSGTGSFLAVLKRCGDVKSPGLLSFPMEGTSLALDFPQRDEPNSRLFAALDSIVREAAGKIYPAKDAHMTGQDFRSAYPDWEQVETLRDPALLSCFWDRVTRT